MPDEQQKNDPPETKPGGDPSDQPPTDPPKPPAEAEPGSRQSGR